MIRQMAADTEAGQPAAAIRRGIRVAGLGQRGLAAQGQLPAALPVRPLAPQPRVVPAVPGAAPGQPGTEPGGGQAGGGPRTHRRSCSTRSRPPRTRSWPSPPRRGTGSSRRCRAERRPAGPPGRTRRSTSPARCALDPLAGLVEPMTCRSGGAATARPRRATPARRRGPRSRAAHAVVTDQLTAALDADLRAEQSTNSRSCCGWTAGGGPGGLRVGELMSMIRLTQPSLSRAVARLEGTGWLRRSGAPGDGRGVLVSLTEAGRRGLARGSRRAHPGRSASLLLDRLTPASRSCSPGR